MSKTENRETLYLLGRLRATIARACDTLDACVARVTEILDSSQAYDSKMASHLAYLLEHGSRALGEIRKLEAHDRASLDKAPPEERDQIVKDYVSALPRERLQEFRAFVESLDVQESVL